VSLSAPKRVSAPFFAVVGARPALGRAFNATDEIDEAPRTAVISDGLWKQHLGADPMVTGRTLRLQLSAATPPQLVEVVGVMPVGFEFPLEVDIWLPASPIVRWPPWRWADSLRGCLSRPLHTTRCR
jgi:MacB-like periplasmic core domain